MVFRQNLLDSRRVPHAQGKQVCTSAAILATPKFKALSLGHAVKRKNTITKGDAKARLSLPCIGFLEDNRSPEETTEQLGCGLRVFDDCTDECMVDDIKNRFGRERGNGRAKPRIHFKFKFSPFNKHPISVPGIAEAEFLHRLCGDPDSTRLHVDHRCLKVIDLNSYRVHATPTSRHKPERATTLDDRLPQFNRVVADPDQQSFISEGQMTAESDEDWDGSKEKVLFDAREKAIQEIVDLIYATPEGKAAHEQFLREANIVPRVRISELWS